MSLKMITTAPVLAAGAAAAVFALAPQASAEPQQPDQCVTGSTTTVCEQPGSSSVVTTPSQSPNGQTGQTPNGQNGEYGPSGSTPPVGSS